MAQNKNALIRYKTIDNCLQNSFKKWTLEDLIDACSDALYEYEGKDEYISKRTIQLDIQNMRSEKLGYNAPIEVYERKYYRYAEPDYSIKKIPVNENDLQVMKDALQILKQFKDFSTFSAMNGVLQKLEDTISATHQKAIIHLEKNERLKGLEFIDVLYQAILNKKVMKITYKSFKAHDSKEYITHPQLLKEFNNRWFIVVWMTNNFMNFALDRIINIDELDIPYIDKNIEGDVFFKDVIGVTVSNNTRVQNVVFQVNKENAPYVITKPFHHSQELLEKTNDYTIFKIKVQLNFELERLLLGFGDAIKIISPVHLQKRILNNLKNAVENYCKN